MTEHTETYNEHWVEEQRPSPYEKFPPFEYFKDLFGIFELEQITWIEKSRDLMVSWACVAYLTLHAMRVPHRGVLFQTQKDDKVIQLVEYAKCLYRRQPQRLQDAYPLTKPIDLQPEHSLSFAAGGYIVGIPGGAHQVRSYHPWGYLNDESSFQADAGECYNEAISAVRGKIIFNSSAGPGWYADARRDISRGAEAMAKAERVKDVSQVLEQTRRLPPQTCKEDPPTEAMLQLPKIREEERERDNSVATYYGGNIRHALAQEQRKVLREDHARGF